MDVTRRSMLKWSGAGVAAAGVAAVVPVGVAEAAADPAPPPEVQAAAGRARQLVARMTLDEKIAYCHGIPATKGFTGHIPANPRLGIPALRLADGPSGVGNGSTGVTQWPDSKALAATWNPDTATAYGNAYGAEQAAKGHNVALAPCINILRVPHWGRSFETYTEDPYLNGQLAAATIRGVQANHVIATVKHFVANNQEILRNSIDVVVSDRALQEIYYPGFRSAVRAGVGAVMTSYNKINGTWAHENRVNVQDVLRDAWGYDGWVMSDWGGTHSTVQTAKAGSDTEMPGGTYLGDALKAAVLSGTVSQAQLDTMVTQVLTPMIRVGLFDHPLPDPATVVDTVVSTPAHLDLARRIGVEGSVLLKNDGVLPFARPRSIAVIGDAADAGAQTHGGGSGSVTSHGPVVTPLAGIRARAGSIPVTYARGTLGIAALPVVPASAFGAGLHVTYYAATDLTGDPLGTETVPNLNVTATPSAVASQTDGWSARYTGTFQADVAGRYRFSLIAGGLTTLSIDGKPVLTSLPGRESVQNAFVPLTAGDHTIEVTYVSAVPAPGGRTPRTSLVLGSQAGYDQLHRGRGRGRPRRRSGRRRARRRHQRRHGPLDVGVARRSGRTRRRGRPGQPAHGGRAEHLGRGPDAVAGQRQGRHRQLVRGAGAGQRGGGDAVRRRRAGRAAARDVPRVRPAGPGEDGCRVPRRRGARLLRRRSRDRVPLVPAVRRAAAVPVRVRAVVHDFPAR
jgi:beta-glucosidase